jgi:hypothetical protein
MANRFERETGREVNYGTSMGSCSRRTHYPDRAMRRAQRRHPDPLVQKRYFACGEAARCGWMLMAWRNGFMRDVVRARIAASRAAGPLPLP